MAMSNAERQARYRVRRKEQGLKRRDAWIPPEIVRQGAEERRDQWEAEVQAEKLKAARKEGRRLARLTDQSRQDGYVEGLCTAAAFFVRHDRADLAKILLGTYAVDRTRAATALEPDKRSTSGTLKTLEAAGIFGPDGHPVKVSLTPL